MDEPEVAQTLKKLYSECEIGGKPCRLCPHAVALAIYCARKEGLSGEKARSLSALGVSDPTAGAFVTYVVRAISGEFNPCPRAQQVSTQEATEYAEWLAFQNRNARPGRLTTSFCRFSAARRKKDLPHSRQEGAICLVEVASPSSGVPSS